MKLTESQKIILKVLENKSQNKIIINGARQTGKTFLIAKYLFNLLKKGKESKIGFFGQKDGISVITYIIKKFAELDKKNFKFTSNKITHEGCTVHFHYTSSRGSSFDITICDNFKSVAEVLPCAKFGGKTILIESPLDKFYTSFYMNEVIYSDEKI